jgi:hypothetical protein
LSIVISQKEGRRKEEEGGRKKKEGRRENPTKKGLTS